MTAVGWQEAGLLCMKEPGRLIDQLSGLFKCVYFYRYPEAFYILYRMQFRYNRNNQKGKRGYCMKDIVTAIRTDKAGARFADCPEVKFCEDKEAVENELLCIYPEVMYQEWEGFGGALTEGVAHNLCRLSAEKQDEVLRAYFDEKEGIGFRFCRTNMESCDFSTEIYSYDDTEDDYELKDFTIEHDRKELLPMLRRMVELYPKVKILASPWSPPAWMKTNCDMCNGGVLRAECRKVWSDCFIKYLEAYEKEGVPIWGFTVQNEAKAPQTWESCEFTAEEEKDFVRDYLGPALQKAGKRDVKIMIWDHNKERVVERTDVAMKDLEAAAYLYGSAVHWYSGDHFDALRIVHEKYPELKLSATENSMGCNPVYTWDMGEKVAHHIIGDLSNFVSSWYIWNLILDEHGMPNHDHGNGKSPMMVNFGMGGILYYAAGYYYTGHFSKFIRPGARRVASSIYTDKLETVTFRNPDGGMVTVVLNRNDIPMKFILRCEGRLAEFVSEAHSIMTLFY